MAKRKKIEQMERAAVLMAVGYARKRNPDTFEFVIVTPENAEKVLQWVAYFTEGAILKADYGDVVVRNIYDNSFEVWDAEAFNTNYEERTQGEKR